MTAAHIAEALKARRSGAGWIACCPAHRDRTPSLSIRETGETVLVHCFAGCPQRDVIAALRERGLWPQPNGQQWSPAAKRQYARRGAEAQAAAEDVAFWRSALMPELNARKISALHAGDDDDALARAASMCHVLDNGSPADVIREFIRQREANPAEVRRLIAVGRERELEARRITAEVVLLLARVAARE